MAKRPYDPTKRHEFYVKHEQGKIKSWYKFGPKPRLQHILDTSKYAAKKFGHEPIKATLLEFIAWLWTQEGVCGMCSRPGYHPLTLNPTNVRKDTLQVDHDHKTGELRGLLCSSCNKILGKIEKYATIARRYLCKTTSLAV